MIRTTAIVSIACLGLPLAACAEQTKTPSLNAILQRLESNLNHFDTRVPSFFCDEHIVSSQAQGDLPAQNTISDSIFRLKRFSEADHTATLSESREVKTVNGKPTTAEDLNGPALLTGMFEGGLAVVSLNQETCMEYRLQQRRSKRSVETYSISFATASNEQRSARCFLQEESKGRALVDSAWMQLSHLEITTPRHVIDTGDPYTTHVGKRQLSVDYAPVLLGGETFWMPSAMTMRIIRGFGYHRMLWSYRATYTNCRKMEVTTRIVP